MPDVQPKSERMTEEQKSRSLGYLRSVLIEEERRNSQVIPLPEEAAPLPPKVAMPIPPSVPQPSVAPSQKRPERWRRGKTGIALTLVAGCLVIGVMFLFQFLTGGGLPTAGDFKLAGIGLLAIWFLTTLDAREERQDEHFEAIERELAGIKKKL